MIKFCNACGGSVSHRIPDEDDRPRYICDSCGFIHYQNPRIVVGVLPTWEDRVLLCRRAIEPRHGLWTLPAGFLENQETIVEGALRETWEEARARVANESLYRIFNLPHISQVYVFYRAELHAEEYAAGPESLDVQLFAEADIPWREIAFPVVSQTLQGYFADRKRGDFPVQTLDIRFPALKKKAI